MVKANLTWSGSDRTEAYAGERQALVRKWIVRTDFVQKGLGGDPWAPETSRLSLCTWGPGYAAAYANNAIHGGASGHAASAQPLQGMETSPLCISINAAFLTHLAAHHSTYLASHDCYVTWPLCVGEGGHRSIPNATWEPSSETASPTSNLSSEESHCWTESGTPFTSMALPWSMVCPRGPPREYDCQIGFQVYIIQLLLHASFCELSNP